MVTVRVPEDDALLAKSRHSSNGTLRPLDHQIDTATHLVLGGTVSPSPCPPNPLGSHVHLGWQGREHAWPPGSEIQFPEARRRCPGSPRIPRRRFCRQGGYSPRPQPAGIGGVRGPAVGLTQRIRRCSRSRSIHPQQTHGRESPRVPDGSDLVPCVKIVRRRNQSRSKVVLPDPVDQDACRQGIVSTGDPVRENPPPTGRSRTRSRVRESWEAGFRAPRGTRDPQVHGDCGSHGTTGGSPGAPTDLHGRERHIKNGDAFSAVFSSGLQGLPVRVPADFNRSRNAATRACFCPAIDATPKPTPGRSMRPVPRPPPRSYAGRRGPTPKKLRTSNSPTG